MKLHELDFTEGARKTDRKRVGRGHGSGWGKTSARGQKGQLSRSGGKSAPGFEGGQTPLYRRISKRGFTNFTRVEYAVVNLETLNHFNDGAEVTPTILKDAGILKDLKNGVKVLGRGKLEKKLIVKAHKFSAAAQAAIEKAGGTIEVL